MNNPGSHVLFAGAITTALSAQVQTAIEDLEGMLAADIVARFAYGGSGGTSVSALIQTTVDGSIWLDVARLDFTTSSAIKFVNLSGLTAKGATAYAALGSEGVNDGLLGHQFRAVITSVGTYVSGTLLDLRMVAR
jgi:hypothetical protein